jgi:hypothetical protein
LPIKVDGSYLGRYRVMTGGLVELYIPAKIKWMEFGRSDESPGQEVETGFYLKGQDILARGDRNHHWKIHKNKLPF